MFEIIISSLYFILPAYFANMAPVAFSKIPFTKRSLPLGRPINEKAFGSHKTWRGFYTGYIGALFVLWLQQYLSQNDLLNSNYFQQLLDYDAINIFFYAFLFGIGAITGDLVKSYFKRRMGIKSGQPWPIFDQLDFIVGALLFLSPFFVPPWQTILVIIIATPLLHLLTNVTAYLLGLKKVWW